MCSLSQRRLRSLLKLFGQTKVWRFGQKETEMYVEEMSESFQLKIIYFSFLFRVGICRKVGEQIPGRSRGQIGYLVCLRVTGTRGPPFSHPKLVTSQGKICQDLRPELDLPLV